MRSRQIDLFRPGRPTTFGSASWASQMDLWRANMFEKAVGKELGPIIGCLTPTEIGGREVKDIYAPGEGHLLTAAPTRSGKGRGQIITNLLWWPGSAIVVDIKGENWMRTAGWRSSVGNKVIRFAPFEDHTETWNPIDQINEGASAQRNDPQRQENASYIANLMITPNPNTKDPYWDNAAKSLLQGLILYVATATVDQSREQSHVVRERTMAEVRRLMTLEPDSFTKLLTEMLSSQEDWVRETAATLMQMADARAQTASVKSMLMEHTHIWAYSRIKKATSHSSFSFSELKNNPGTTIYLDIPPEHLDTYRPLLRVLVGSCMKELRQSSQGGVDQNIPPVMFFLDEFPQLAYMKPIEDALLYIGSYGVKFWFFVQDISQLKQHYEKTWQQFIANCNVRTFFSVSDLETAKMVSEMSGSGTVINRAYQVGTSESEASSETVTDSDGRSVGGGWLWNTWQSRSTGSAYSYGKEHSQSFDHSLRSSFVGRPLLFPNEVLSLPFGSFVALVRGMPAIKGQLKFWDQCEETFADRGKISPPQKMSQLKKASE